MPDPKWEMNDQVIESGMVGLMNIVRKRIDRYGREPYASTHEGLGLAIEEMDELRTEIHDNNMEGIQKEALDLAVVCVWLAMSIDSGGLTK